MNPETIPTKAAGNPANQTVASPKLRDEFHAAARLRHLAFRTEEAYWDWVVMGDRRIFFGTVIRVLNKVKGDSGAGLRPAPAAAPNLFFRSPVQHP